ETLEKPRELDKETHRLRRNERPAVQRQPGQGVAGEEITLRAPQTVETLLVGVRLSLLESQEMQELELAREMIGLLTALCGERQAEEVVEAHQLFERLQVAAAVMSAVQRTAWTRLARFEKPRELDLQRIVVRPRIAQRRPVDVLHELRVEGAEHLAQRLGERSLADDFKRFAIRILEGDCKASIEQAAQRGRIGRLRCCGRHALRRRHATCFLKSTFVSRSFCATSYQPTSLLMCPCLPASWVTLMGLGQIESLSRPPTNWVLNQP